MQPKTRFEVICLISETVPEEAPGISEVLRDSWAYWYSHKLKGECNRCSSYNVKVSTSWEEKKDKERSTPGIFGSRSNVHLRGVRAKCLNCGIEMDFRADDRIIYKSEVYTDPNTNNSEIFVRDGLIESINGISSTYAKRLKDAGVQSHEDLIAVDTAGVASETGISENRIRDWQDTAAEQL